MASETTRRPLPEPTGPGTYEKIPGIESKGYGVFSHSSDPVPGRTPPDAVLLRMDCEFNGKPFALAMRLKSRAAVDQLIDALERHAVDVWPKHKGAR